MDRQKFEESCATKFCVKLGKSATVTGDELQRAYGEHSLSSAQVFRRHKFFLEGRGNEKTNLVREDLQPQKPRTMWKE